MERVKNIVYLAFTDVRDALAFSAVVARDHDKISVEFIQVNDLNDVSSQLNYAADKQLIAITD